MIADSQPDVVIPFLRFVVRLLAMCAFSVGLAITWAGPQSNGVDWRWFFTCIFIGNALFVSSFMLDTRES